MSSLPIKGVTLDYNQSAVETTSATASLIQNVIKAVLVVAFVVIPPAATLIYMRWDSIKPYLIADADTAEGTLYYFTGSG